MLATCDVLVCMCSVVRKAAQYLGDVLDDERDKVKENLLVNGS
jgi:hypothetical protein